MGKAKGGDERRIPKPPFENLGELLDRLGGIPPERVCWNPLPGTATAADYARRDGRSDNGVPCELVERTLVEKAMGASEPTLNQTLSGYLFVYLLSNPIAFLSGDTYPWKIKAGIVRSPDLSVTLWSTRPDGTIPTGSFATDTPALAVEVLSPSNTAAEMRRKLGEYFGAGVQVVWLVNPRTRSAKVYTSPESKIDIDETGSLTAEGVLPGFALPLATLFARMPQPAAKKPPQPAAKKTAANEVVAVAPVTGRPTAWPRRSGRAATGRRSCSPP